MKPEETWLTIGLQDAIDALNSLQTPFAVIEARRKAGIKPNEASMHEMRVYLTRIGYTVWARKSNPHQVYRLACSIVC